MNGSVKLYGVLVNTISVFIIYNSLDADMRIKMVLQKQAMQTAADLITYSCLSRTI